MAATQRKCPLLAAGRPAPRDWSRLPQRSHLPVVSPREPPAEPDPRRFGLGGGFDIALAVIAVAVEAGLAAPAGA